MCIRDSASPDASNAGPDCVSSMCAQNRVLRPVRRRSGPSEHLVPAPSLVPVSYTHLRAHETGAYL
eukprot:7452236-Pyramimonas_sp.AAC.1